LNYNVLTGASGRAVEAASCAQRRQIHKKQYKINKNICKSIAIWAKSVNFALIKPVNGPHCGPETSAHAPQYGHEINME